MTAESYSFIDIVALPDVRERFARGDAMFVLSTDLATVLWANGSGAALFRSDIDMLIDAPAPLGTVARRQLAALPGFPRLVGRRNVAVRVTSGAGSRILNLTAETIALPANGVGILLWAPDAAADGGRVLEGIAQPGQFAALLDGSGLVTGGSPGVEDLQLSPRLMQLLIAEAASRPDNLVKRKIETAGRILPAGLAHLGDDANLLIVVDENFVELDDDVLSVSEETPSEAAGGEAFLAEAAPDDLSGPGVDITLVNDSGEDWYFKGSETADAPTQAQERLTELTASAPVRFAWRTDPEGRFTAISPEFLDAVELTERELVGQLWSALAKRFGFDRDGEIAGRLAGRDTWSGSTVFWPLAYSQLLMPVDFAALPTFSRARTFEGFRGFGVARLSDAFVRTEDAPTVESAQPAAEEPEQPAAPSENQPVAAAGSTLKDQSDRIVRLLAETRQPANDRGLSPNERNAFAEIGKHLKGAGPAPNEPPSSDAESASATLAPASEEGPSEDAGRSDAAAHAIAANPSEHQPSDASPDAASSSAPLTEDRDAPSLEVAISVAPEAEMVEAFPENQQREPHDTSAEVEPGTADGPLREEPKLTDAENMQAGFAEDSGLEMPLPDGGGGEQDRTEVSPAEAPNRTLLPDGSTAASFEDATISDIPDAEVRDSPEEPEVGAGDVDRTEVRVPASSEPEIASEPLRQATDTSILEELPIPVLIHAGDRLFYANPEFLSLTGHSSLDAFEAAGGLGSLFGGSTDEPDGNRHLKLRDARGAEFPVDTLLRTVPWNDGKALLLSLRRLEEPTPPPAVPAESESDAEMRLVEMRAIVDTATDGVVLIARDFAVRSLSRPAEALFGIDSHEAAGKPFGALFAAESQRAVADYLDGLADNGVASVLNDGREVIGREKGGGAIPLFMTIGTLPEGRGFCAVLRDITQWKRAEEELTQSRALAERASSHKTEFLARVSHEIRTPLNAIIGFSELMLDEKFGPVGSDRYRDYLRDINRSGNHVLALVNDLLDISKIEAGQQELTYEAVSLNDALTETVATMQPQANRERVIIRSSLAADLPEVVADHRSVRQIALNILSNAIRFTPAGGQVIVSSAQETSGDVVLRVRDTGIGMSQAEIEQALKPFKQINSLKRPRNDGTGLGLPLTKAMVEANRARFAIASTPGEGTLVEVVFPSTRVLV